METGGIQQNYWVSMMFQVNERCLNKHLWTDTQSCPLISTWALCTSTPITTHICRAKHTPLVPHTHKKDYSIATDNIRQNAWKHLTESFHSDAEVKEQCLRRCKEELCLPKEGNGSEGGCLQVEAPGTRMDMVHHYNVKAGTVPFIP